MNVGFNKGKNLKGKRKIFSDINITPFVDIVLVLLIIFMVTAPMLNTGFEVNLPKVSSNKVSMNKKEYIIFSVDKLGKVRVGEEILSLKEVSNYLKNYNVSNTQVFIKGDKSSHYGAIIELMALINKNGFSNLALVTDNLNE